jgi:cation diffusion facilitator family transporter
VQRLALGSIAVGLVVLALKLAAWRLTGSVALYSDALESIINVVTAIAAFMAIRISAQPADDGHPYGHNKAEYFSAVLEGVLIVLAALVILRESWLGWLHPKPLDTPALGLAVSGAATVLNLAWGQWLIRRGRQARSPALTADGHHLMSDVLTSGGVLVGVAAVALTGWTWLDAAMAALVALHILWSGTALMRDSVGGLMDAALPSEERLRIEALIAAHQGEQAAVLDLRTRMAGPMAFIDFTLQVPGELSVAAAHARCDAIELALREALGQASITIHLEPLGA